MVGTASPNAIPGISVHRDMQLLVDAGIPPMKALQAATTNIAEMTRKAADLGTLEVGKYADKLQKCSRIFTKLLIWRLAVQELGSHIEIRCGQITNVILTDVGRSLSIFRSDVFYKWQPLRDLLLSRSPVRQHQEFDRGYPGTSHWRNSHTAVNSAYMWKLFWDGSALALEPQGKSANTGLSGNGKTDMMGERLRQVPEYGQRFKEVFGTEKPLLEDAWRAIAAFQRTLIQVDTPFDLYMKGDQEALDEAQIRGLELFQGKAKCIRCHNGPMFSNQKYYNLGIPQQPSFLEDPLQQITHRFEYASKGITEDLYRKGKIDLGLYFVTKRKEDIGKFRVQTLRNLFFTPPYMHNGVFDTLEEVVDFYNDGGEEDLTEKTYGIANKSELLEELDLTDDEKDDLVAFLDSLTGDEIYMDNPELPNLMAFVYQGETYVGLPIPVVSADLEERAAQTAAGTVTWSLVEGPEGMTIDPGSGRVTWLNAQPPAGAADAPITITIRSETAAGATEDQTLQVTVLPQAPAASSTTAGLQ